MFTAASNFEVDTFRQIQNLSWCDSLVGSLCARTKFKLFLHSWLGWEDLATGHNLCLPYSPAKTLLTSITHCRRYPSTLSVHAHRPPPAPADKYLQKFQFKPNHPREWGKLFGTLVALRMNTTRPANTFKLRTGRRGAGSRVQNSC